MGMQNGRIPSFRRLYQLAPVIVFAILLLTIIRASVFGGDGTPSNHFYFDIAFLLLVAVAGEIAVLYFRQPSVMVLMLLGIAMSPSAIALVWGALGQAGIGWLPSEPPEFIRDEGVLNVFAQLGAVILLFKVGIENSIDKVFSLDNFSVALLGVLVPFAAGYAYASFTGGSFAYSLFLGAALTATSVGVTVAILKDFGLLSERFARVIIGAAVIDDVLGLLALSFVQNVSGGTSRSRPSPQPSWCRSLS